MPGRAEVSVDLDHGGRWTSLRMGGREWLWSRDEPWRTTVAPGDPFADAGGSEECVPTVRGRPDHGDAWSRAWRGADPEAAEVSCEDFLLRRRIAAAGSRVTARYRLSADPGYRFVWAAHALLDVSALATARIPGSPAVRLYPEAAGFLDRPWPQGAPYCTVRWPGPDGLRLSLTAGAGRPASVALWRNLGGFPDGRPYRSIGVEPMLGSVFDLAEARQEGDAVTVPPGGYVEWELEIEVMTVETVTTGAAS